MPDGALPSEPDTHPENSSGSTCGSATLKWTHSYCRGVPTFALINKN
jgi:hypothetical protein